MKLKVLGSSSAGNCYLFDNGKECLVVECGIPFREVQKAVDFDIARIVGCLVSHEHGDHAKHVKSFLRARIPVWASSGTIVAIEGGVSRPKMEMLIPNRKQVIGNFVVLPFEVQHDAAEPFGFLIYHEEMGTVLFATDTYYLKYKFKGLMNILLECNYDSTLLEDNYKQGRISKQQRDRTLQSHMSYETCKEVLAANDLSEVNNIVLIHLSDANSRAEEFKHGIRELTCKNVHTADAGMEIEFNKTPF